MSAWMVSDAQISAVISTALKMNLISVKDIKRIGQNRDKMSLKIYPNPSQNEVNVEFTNQETIDCIKLFDLNGKLIWTSTKNLDTPIDISYLGSGIYFLQAFSERGSSVAKLIKN